MQVEEQSEEQFNKIMQISYVGTKLTKLQLQQMNLEKIIKQCVSLINEGISFRECATYLHGLALVYLRQYQLLRQEISQLQHSMMNKENFIEIEKKQNPRSKNKSIKPRQIKEAIVELQENSNNSRDNPRNIASAEKLQLESNRVPFDMNMILRREESDNSNSYGSVQNILRDVQSVEKQSLSEILQNRKKNNNDSQASKDTPMAPLELIDNALIEEQQMEIGDIQEQSQIDDIEDIQQEVKHVDIMRALEDFGIFLTLDGKKKENNNKKQTKKVQPQNYLDNQDKEQNEEYQKNLDEFIKYQDKIDDLQRRMDLLNLQPEFWSKQDDLINMINQYEIPLNQTVLNQQQSFSHSKLAGMTTTMEQTKQQQEFTHFDNEQIEITEFDQIEESKNERFQVYERLIMDLRDEFQKDKVINQIKYFNFREKKQNINKPKAFYDLLVMSRIGLCQLQQKQQVDDGFSNIQIEF